MSLSQITCRLNVACDMFVRKLRRRGGGGGADDGIPMTRSLRWPLHQAVPARAPGGRASSERTAMSIGIEYNRDLPSQARQPDHQCQHRVGNGTAAGPLASCRMAGPLAGAQAAPPPSAERTPAGVRRTRHHPAQLRLHISRSRPSRAVHRGHGVGPGTRSPGSRQGRQAS